MTIQLLKALMQPFWTQSSNYTKFTNNKLTKFNIDKN
jgi:hypothetical protein